MPLKINETVQSYIDKINSNDSSLREIALEGLMLHDADIAPLIHALKRNPNVARRITKLDLECNEFTSISIPEEMVALQWLNLSDNQFISINIPELKALEVLDLYNNSNQLTDATKISLNAESTIRGANFELYYDDALPDNATLTFAILDDHFKKILQVNRDEAIANLENSHVLKMLMTSLPTDISIEFMKYDDCTRVGYVCASMIYLQNTFTKLAELSGDKTQLNILNQYNDTRFAAIINAAKNYYVKLIYGFEKVIVARKPLLFSQAFPVTDESAHVNKKAKRSLF